MRVFLSQINPVIGDLEFNYSLIEKSYGEAVEKKSDLIVFSELCLTGYPPEDLLNKGYFIKDVSEKIDQICRLTKDGGCSILVGAPVLEKGGIYNSALLIKDGEVVEKFFKKELPNYGVFDEKRYFKSCENFRLVEISGFKVVVMICEDIWEERNVSEIKELNPDLVLSLNASPYQKDKFDGRVEVSKKFSLGVGCPLFYVNQVGGVDSLVFDGKSFIIDENGDVIFKMKGFEEDFEIVEVKRENEGKNIHVEAVDGINLYKNSNIKDYYLACVLGLRDYVSKTGFKSVILGMSGGIDSAMVAMIAVDALGSENVRLVALPSRFNSKESYLDAKECAQNLGIELEVIEIENIFSSFLDGLSEKFEGKKSDLTEENIQSRIRGVLLMAMSNKFGNLLISTGNKSEMAVGYATIYGDMCGAYNPLKDIYKSEVFELARWRNENISEISILKKTNLIPENIIVKPPSAELREDQKDSDSLPDYDILDKILYLIIEEEKSVKEVVKETGFDEEIVQKISRLFYQSEYKRKQAVIGPKLSKMSFDRERRYLISNKFWK